MCSIVYFGSRIHLILFYSKLEFKAHFGISRIAWQHFTAPIEATEIERSTGSERHLRKQRFVCPQPNKHRADTHILSVAAVDTADRPNLWIRGRHFNEN